MVFTPPSVVAPKDGALGQASPKDAQRRHVATLAINLVFCPLSIIELILLSENENQNRNLQNFIPLFSAKYLLRHIVDGSSIEHLCELCGPSRALRESREQASQGPTIQVRASRKARKAHDTSTFHTRSANCEVSIFTSRN